MKVFAVRYLISILLLVAAGSTYAQSSDQMFPSPVRTSEILSSIKARAVGDPRVTTYYYTFEGQQGDVFINVQSKNFTGDIDVYLVPTQQPLTKIVIYGEQPEAETGRVIYLRKPERLLLRIQGRSPGDDDASVRIKFAGSFSASKLDDTDNPPVPKVESLADSDVRVNSVGTILEVRTRPEPTPTAEGLEGAPDPHESRDTGGRRAAVRDEREVEAEEARSVEVVRTDPVGDGKKVDAPKPAATSRNRNRRRATTATAGTVPAAENVEAKKEEAGEPSSAGSSRNRSPAPTDAGSPKVDPMAGINLVIYFKDGSRVDRPMTEVQRFSVERAVLTVISKNGTIGRYNMTEVSRVSIE